MRTFVTTGILLFSVHLTAQWTSLQSGTLVEFSTVLIDDVDTYWVGGENGILLHTTDGGATWTTQMLTAAGDIEKLIRYNANTLLMAADDGVIGRSVDNGANWTFIQTQAPNVLYDLAFHGDHVWASGRDGGMVHSMDQGVTWGSQTSGTTQRIHGIHALSATNVVAVARNGVLLNTTNGGTTWQTSTIAGGEDLRGVIFLDDAQQTGLIAGPPGEFMRSTDQGNTWTSVSFPSALEAQAFASEVPDLVYAVGDNALILRSLDQGLTWEAMTSTGFSELSGVDVKDGVALAVGANGTILKLGESNPQSVTEALDPNALVIYPNPSRGRVTIDWAGSAQQDALTLDVLLADGRLVDRTQWPIGKSKAHIDQLAAGNYIIRMVSSEGTSVQRSLIVTGE